MHGKRRTGTVVTESTAQAALRRGPARALAPEEEKVVRLRLGASLPPASRLERLAVATDTEIEILAYEIEAYLRLRARPAPGSARQGSPSVTPQAQAPAEPRAKDRIVRALRRKA
jgi:hypothetical protein